MSELYNLPNGWEWTSIAKTVLKTENKNPLAEPNVYFTYIDISSVDNQMYRIKEPKYLIGHEAPSRAKKEVFIDDIIFATTRPNLKNIAIVLDDYENPIASTGFCVLRAQENIDSKFLFYFLFTNDLSEQVEAKIRGAQYPAISDKDLMSCVIPLPPLPEQQRIVSKLDLLFEIIDKSIALHQKNIDEANVFMGSVLNDVFGELKINKTIPLKDITTKIGSGATPSGGQKAYKTKGISLIRSMNVHDYGFRTKGLAFIDDSQAKKLNNVAIVENDVLLNITGASVARCCIVDKDYLPARVNQHVSILRLKDGMIPSFLHYYLISPSIKSDLLFSSSGGATREAITKSMLEEFQVPVVSLSIQQKTVKYLNEISQKIEKVKSVQKEKMANLKALKASILDSAFRGAL